MAGFRLGYVANCLSFDLTASHTCRLVNATPERLEHLVALNLAELEQILLFNEAHQIQVFRIGSALVPLASHPVNRTKWWKTFARDFDHLARIARRSHQRLSLHPGSEAASLSSARPIVREAAVRELLYATRVLDLFEQDANARVVLHVGGAAPDPRTALESAGKVLDEMPEDARRRLVLEHDDRIWPARPVYAFAKAHGLPFLADNLHNAVLPSDPPLETGELLALAARTWHDLGLRPKHHLATQKPGARPGAHSDRIATNDALEVISVMKDDADFMMEAKDKDFALLQLRAGLRRAGFHEALLETDAVEQHEDDRSDVWHSDDASASGAI